MNLSTPKMYPRSESFLVIDKPNSYGFFKKTSGVHIVTLQKNNLGNFSQKILKSFFGTLFLRNYLPEKLEQNYID